MNETVDKKYKDDASAFAQSSDLANRGASDEYAGGGTEASANFVPAKGEQAWQRGEKEGIERTDAAHVESRSQDPGQSSYGGFKDEGPATEDGHQKP